METKYEVSKDREIEYNESQDKSTVYFNVWEEDKNGDRHSPREQVEIYDGKVTAAQAAKLAKNL